jgi:hypothetical protein
MVFLDAGATLGREGDIGDGAANPLDATNFLVGDFSGDRPFDEGEAN